MARKYDAPAGRFEPNGNGRRVCLNELVDPKGCASKRRVSSDDALGNLALLNNGYMIVRDGLATRAEAKRLTDVKVHLKANSTGPRVSRFVHAFERIFRDNTYQISGAQESFIQIAEGSQLHPVLDDVLVFTQWREEVKSVWADERIHRSTCVAGRIRNVKCFALLKEYDLTDAGDRRRLIQSGKLHGLAHEVVLTLELKQLDIKDPEEFTANILQVFDCSKWDRISTWLREESQKGAWSFEGIWRKLARGPSTKICKVADYSAKNIATYFCQIQGQAMDDFDFKADDLPFGSNVAEAINCCIYNHSSKLASSRTATKSGRAALARAIHFGAELAAAIDKVEYSYSDGTKRVRQRGHVYAAAHVQQLNLCKSWGLFKDILYGRLHKPRRAAAPEGVKRAIAGATASTSKRPRLALKGTG